MDVSVIIPARDAAATLPDTLDALRAQVTEAAFEVIVVDDGSSDETRAIANAAGTMVVPGHGDGPAAARNLGAARARGRLLAFTDADCVPAADWLSAGLEAARSADLVQGRVLPPPDARVGRFDRHITVLSEYGLYETANLFVARELFERLGGFESILVPHNGKELGEDVWLGWRARRAGARTSFAEAALVHHAVFRRGPRGYIAERWRLRFFPELARRVPELRTGFFHRRVFLSARSARFDLALVALVAGVSVRRPRLLLLTIPYGLLLRGAGPRVAAVEVAADAVGSIALVTGSLRSRALLL